MGTQGANYTQGLNDPRIRRDLLTGVIIALERLDDRPTEDWDAILDSLEVLIELLTPRPLMQRQSHHGLPLAA